MIYGIDYASHQGWIDFAQLRAEGNEFAITKVTGEGSYINPYWERNHAAARAAGLIVGTYDWVEPQGDLSGDEAARDYLRVVGERQSGDLLTVDFETPEWYTGPRGRDIEAWMRTYLYTLKSLSGQPVIVYTAPYFLQETGAVDWDWLGRDFLYWMAAPGNATGPDDQLPDDGAWQQPLGPPWSVVTLHQHQWYARSSAIGSGANFDRNRFNGTKEDLIALGMPAVESAVSSPAEVIAGALQRADGFMDPIKVEFYDAQEPGAGIPYYMALKAYNPDTGAHYQKEWVEGVYQPWALLEAPPASPEPEPQPVPPVAPPPAPTPDPIPPTQEAAIMWFKLHGGNLDADSNAYDRFQGAEGRATVFRKGRQLFGFIQPWDGPERAWGPIDVPPEGNVQQVRIFPEGTWTVFALVDPMDGKRAEYGISVAPL